MNCAQSSMRYMRSSLPREASFQSSHSNGDDIVSRSSTVMFSLRGSAFCSLRRRSGNRSRIFASTLLSFLS